ncbi:MAG: ankyrin repeat domain-containing protein [Planctomycetota bacterium]|jgi:ankyrin repeat protein
MKKTLVLLFFSFLGCVNTYATEPSEWTKALYESVRFAENGNDRIVDINQAKVALENGANPNWIDDERETSIISWWILMICTSDDPKITNDGLEIIKLLFEKNAKLQRYDESILFFPIAHGQTAFVELLIKKGASPTAKFDGKTPVEWAETYGYSEVVKVLVKHGAEPIPKKQALQDRFVKLATESYKDNQHFEQWNILEMEETLKDGATVNGKNSTDQIALVEAIAGAYNVEDYITVAYVLQKGANPNLKSAQHWSGFDGIALHHAVGFHGIMVKDGEDSTIFQKLIIEALLNAGAHVSSRGYNGMTPLHIAAKENDMYVTTTLIKAGAKIMDKDDTGKTPLDYAESAEMINLLKSHGAKEL